MTNNIIGKEIKTNIAREFLTDANKLLFKMASKDISF